MKIRKDNSGEMQNELTIVDRAARRLKSEDGFSLLGTFFLFLLVSFMTVSVLQMTSASTITAINDYDKERSFYAANAGLEWAKYRLARGEKPVTNFKVFNNKDVHGGSFSVKADFNTRTLVATGKVGMAKSVQSIKTMFAADCVGFDQKAAFVEAQPSYLMIRNYQLKKSCTELKNLRIDRIAVVWPNAQPTQALTQIIQGDNKVVFNRLLGQTPVGVGIGQFEADIADVIMTGYATITAFQSIRIDYPQYGGPVPPTSFEINIFFSDGSVRKDVVSW